VINNTYTSEVQKLASLAQQIKSSVEPNRSVLVSEYLRQLNELMDKGWLYALGKSDEIEQSLLPGRYVNQRNKVIDDLQIELGQLAGNYRASAAGSKKEILDYHKTFAELLRINGKVIALDPDSELPDEDMPKVYVDYW